MTKERKSELQKATDRVREMQVAVEKMEDNLKVCEREHADLVLKLAEAKRNLQDTNGLLWAQRQKLERELSSVIEIARSQGGNIGYAECAKVSNGY